MVSNKMRTLLPALKFVFFACVSLCSCNVEAFRVTSQGRKIAYPAMQTQRLSSTAIATESRRASSSTVLFSSSSNQDERKKARLERKEQKAAKKAAEAAPEYFEYIYEADLDETSKFGLIQRIQSIIVFVFGAVIGSLAMLPASLVHELSLRQTLSPLNNNALAQFEFDSDAAAIQAGLFAIVYRYCIREDTNPQLKEGVVNAFILTRTLSRIVVPTYCTPIALDCGEPLGYLDWAMIGQLAINGIESYCLFGAAAVAVETLIDRKIISKFPG